MISKKRFQNPDQAHRTDYELMEHGKVLSNGPGELVSGIDKIDSESCFDHRER